MSSYQELEEHFRGIADFEHAQSILGWDEASMMPMGGGESRARAMAAIAVLVHQRKTESKLSDLLAGAAEEELDVWQQANLREITREVELATCLPADFVEQQSRACARSEQAWRELRAANDWEGMLPLLTEVVTLAREEGAIRSEASGLGRYDALLDQFEPGVLSAEVDAQFSNLRSFLPGFLNEVLEHQASKSLLSLGDHFSVESQRTLGLEMMSVLGFDFDHGRLDISHHPFCGGVPDDVRITTRYNEDNFLESLMGVIHETGHAIYEQGLPDGWRDQPVGKALGAAEHESQSLLMEMQACRSREFVTFLAPIARRILAGDNYDESAWSVENLYRHYTRVRRGLIRVDADEVTYPLHVILRYDIEKPLIEGKIEVTDIPGLWAEKMQSFLGLDVEGDYRDGCMQDVHWMCGLFGYFPTYSLGAMMAAQLFTTAKKDRSGVMGELEQGDFSGLLGWLRQHVHGKGSLLSAPGMLQAATGSTLDADYYIKHLQQRYLAE